MPNNNDSQQSYITEIDAFNIDLSSLSVHIAGSQEFSDTVREMINHSNQLSDQQKMRLAKVLVSVATSDLKETFKKQLESTKESINYITQGGPEHGLERLAEVTKDHIQNGCTYYAGICGDDLPLDPISGGYLAAKAIEEGKAKEETGTGTLNNSNNSKLSELESKIEKREKLHKNLRLQNAQIKDEIVDGRTKIKKIVHSRNKDSSFKERKGVSCSSNCFQSTEQCDVNENHT